MAQTSVAQFATDLKMPAPALLEQLQMAGVVKSKADDLLSEQDKAKLLDYLRRAAKSVLRIRTENRGRFRLKYAKSGSWSNATPLNCVTSSWQRRQRRPPPMRPSNCRRR